jgi:hypothetical protein
MRFEFFISKIVIKDDLLSISYLSEAGPVTRFGLEPSAFFAVPLAKLEAAIVVASGFDLGFWSLADFHISSIQPNLSKYGKDELEADPKAEAELASIQVKLSTPSRKEYPNIQSVIEIPWELASRNTAITSALDEVIEAAIKTLKKPVEQEAIQLRLFPGTATKKHLSIVGEPQAVDTTAAEFIDIDAYTYDPADLLDKNDNPLGEALLPQRKRKLIKENKATPIPLNA